MTEKERSNPCVRDDGHIGEILKRHSDMVYRIAYARTRNRYDSEDIMQDVFLKYIRRTAPFECEEHEKAWFIRAAVHRSNSLLSSPWFKKTVPPEESAVYDEAEESEVFLAVKALSPQLRILVHLYYYEDLKIREIADMLGKSESYVKSALARARKKLKIELEESDNV